ncbi:MAG: excinuclease ABC subunit UvrC [Melioribacteraceae bacterium]|nr:excinuclease ABC subunit UvrC [Melioribacteraceae bacterium]
MNELLKQKLENLPNSPGIYQYKNDKGKIIYVGKAKNLRNRVKSYFHGSTDSPKTTILVSKIADIELIITANEIEALVLENNLIKQIKPHYNINLKDDKTFPYIRVTNELFPQIFPTRTIIRDGSKYFGPYTDVKNMKNSLRMISKLFKIRSCKYDITNEAIEKKKIKICLDYHIKKCEGPCEGLVSSQHYQNQVNRVIKILKGKTSELIDELKKEMSVFASNLEFEKAADLRDKIEQLSVYTSKQRIVSSDMDDRDIISAANEGKDVAATILNIRSGRLVGKKQMNLSSLENEDLSKIYASIIKFYYDEFVEIPKEIIVEIEPEETDTLIEWLNNKSGKKCSFTIPQKQSEAKSLLHMCKQNAILQLKEIQLQRMKKEGNLPYVLSALQRDLRLKKLPRVIECFDNSNLQGTDAVASMVCFIDGKPKKSLYRKFIIKTVEGPDDFASMREIIERRYKRLVEEKKDLPDLVMVDGGKGQLSSAIEILKNLGLSNIEVIGLAKRLEEVFLPYDTEAQSIPKTSSSLKLLQHLRDEAHRFAISFHRERRSKRTITTELTEINGIGGKLAEKLLTELESVEKIKSASIETLTKVVGKAKAKTIYEHYNPGTTS